jgi:hypothetical protein
MFSLKVSGLISIWYQNLREGHLKIITNFVVN